MNPSINLATNECPAAADLAALLGDHLDESRRQALEDHIGTCLRCQQSMLDLAGVIEGIDALSDAPANIVPPTEFLARMKQVVATEAAKTLADRAAVTGKLPANLGIEILEEIGRGATSVVYRAKQASLDRIVAVKVMPADHLAPDSLIRTQRGVEALATLVHPNVVQVFDVGQAGNLAYGLLEYVPGGTLKRRLREHPYAPADAARMVRTIAQAVAFVHARGIVHRDLKTSNILLCADGQPKIVDFGLAKRLDDPGKLTADGDVLGTPAYMAPELANHGSGNAGPLVDVFSLGIILYELLTGRLPFHGPTSLDTLYQVVHLPPMPPTLIAPQIPPDLESICLKCLSKEPESRYRSAQAFADDLGHFLAGEPIDARPAATTERLTKWLRRRPDLALLIGLLLLLSLVVIVSLAVERQMLKRMSQQNAADLEESRKQTYDLLLGIARQAIATNDFAAARETLEKCDPPLRDTRWRELDKIVTEKRF